MTRAVTGSALPFQAPPRTHGFRPLRAAGPEVAQPRLEGAPVPPQPGTGACHWICHAGEAVRWCGCRGLLSGHTWPWTVCDGALRLCLAHFPGVLRSTGIWETGAVCTGSRHWPPTSSCDFCPEDVSVYAVKLVSLFLCCFWSFHRCEKGWCLHLAGADLEHEAVRHRGLERLPSLPFGGTRPCSQRSSRPYRPVSAPATLTRSQCRGVPVLEVCRPASRLTQPFACLAVTASQCPLSCVFVFLCGF